jgi:uncharacterized protein (TIGR02118 family)
VATFVSLYRKPEDVEGFEAYFRDTHLPIVQRWPGIQATRIRRTTGTPRGGDAEFHLVVEVDFATDEEMAAALRSDAGMESARDARAMMERFGVAPTMMLARDF